MAKTQNDAAPVAVEQTEKKEIEIYEMTMLEIKEQIAAYQNAIAGKKAVVLTDAVKAAKKAYQGLSSQGIAMPQNVFVSSLKDLSESERETLKNELEGGLKGQTFAEYAVLDDIRLELLSLVKMCSYKKSGKASTGKGDRKVKLSNFTAKCPICGETIGNPSGMTQKHLVVNQMRLHMLNKHSIEKEQFNKEYRALINDTTIATEPIVEEVR